MLVKPKAGGNSTSGKQSRFCDNFDSTELAENADIFWLDNFLILKSVLFVHSTFEFGH